MKKIFKKILFAFGIGIIASLIILVSTKLILPDLWTNLENRTYDIRYFLRYADEGTYDNTVMEGVQAVDLIDDIVIVNIDERSMLSDKLGVYWKWPRSYHGEVIKYLKNGNNAVTSFDIHFNDADFGQKEADRILSIFEQYKKKNRNNFLPNLDRLKEVVLKGVNYDQDLVKATKEAGNVIHAMILNDTINYANKSDYIKRTTEKHRLTSNPKSSAKMRSFNTEKLPEFKVLDGAFPKLAQAAARIGLVNVIPDNDGVHRKIPLLYKFRGYVYPSLSLQTCLYLMGKDLNDVEFLPGKYLNLGKPFWVQKNKKQKINISFPGINEKMIRSLLNKKDEIIKLENGESVAITEKVVLKRNKNGNITAEIFAGTLNFSSIKDLNGISEKQFMDMPEGQPVAVGNSTGLIKTSKNLFTLAELANNQKTLEEIPLSTLINIAGIDPKKIMEMKNNSNLVVSNNLNVTKIAGRLKTEYVLLNDRVLNQILKYKNADLNTMKTGQKYEFGDPIQIPVDKFGRMRINYQGLKQRTFKTISYYDVKEKRIPAEYFCGKIALIGSDAPSMFDIVSSPVSNTYPGVEIHATVMDNILKKDFMKKLDNKYMTIILLVLCLIIAVVTFFMRPLFAVIVSIFFALAYIVISITLFNQDLFLEIVKPVFGIFVSFISVIIYRYITEEKDKKFLKSTFQNYLSPELIDLMYESKKIPELGGDEGVRTAYFTDIQSFSTFSEKLGSPTRLVELLNEYLSEMTDILMKNNGTLDKYEGDAIIAFFGAPMPLEDHAEKACLTAIEMQNKLLELRKKWASEGDKWPTIVHNMRMRIGVNTGPIVTGNMGSKKRMNYTMMGDAVNLAARLESAAKQYGIFTMISHYTKDMIGDKFELRELDKITVVGKSEPITVYELLSVKNSLDQKVKEMRDIYLEGLAFYKKQNWDKAIELFEKSKKFEIERLPDSKINPSEMYIERCKEFKNDPPQKDWDGIFRLTSK